MHKVWLLLKVSLIGESELRFLRPQHGDGREGSWMGGSWMQVGGGWQPHPPKLNCNNKVSLNYHSEIKMNNWMAKNWKQWLMIVLTLFVKIVR